MAIGKGSWQEVRNELERSLFLLKVFLKEFVSGLCKLFVEV
jgi:hypothetical protein